MFDGGFVLPKRLPPSVFLSTLLLTLTAAGLHAQSEPWRPITDQRLHESRPRGLAELPPYLRCHRV